jgi:hypothetical protein
MTLPRLLGPKVIVCVLGLDCDPTRTAYCDDDDARGALAATNPKVDAGHYATCAAAM